MVGEVEVDRGDRDPARRDRAEVGPLGLLVAGLPAVDLVAAAAVGAGLVEQPQLVVVDPFAERRHLDPGHRDAGEVDVDQRRLGHRLGAQPVDQAGGELGGDGEVEAAADVAHAAARGLLREGDRGDAEDDPLERRGDRARIGDVVAEVGAVVDPGDDQVGPAAAEAELGEADAVDRRAVGRVADVAVFEGDLLDRQRRARGDAARRGAAVRVGGDRHDLERRPGRPAPGAGPAARGRRSRRRWSAVRASDDSDLRCARVSAILPPVTTVRLDIEYDGAGFRGWARQPDLRTVQGVLEAALEQVLREPIQLTVAGRTDTGVHALGQVASFDDRGAAAPRPGPQPERGDARGRRGPPRRSGRGRLRRPPRRPLPLLPLPGGDAPARATPFERGRALWWPHPIDREALDACATALIGPTTSPPSPRPRPTTSASTASSPRRPGARSRARGPEPTSCPSASPPTPSCATWSEPWSARCWRSPPAAERVENFSGPPLRGPPDRGRRHRPTPRPLPGVSQLRLRRPAPR